MASQESDLSISQPGSQPIHQSISSKEKASNAFKIIQSAHEKAHELVNDVFAKFMLSNLMEKNGLYCDGTQYLILAEHVRRSIYHDNIDIIRFDKVPDPSVHLQKPGKIPLRVYSINGSSFVFHPEYFQNFLGLLSKYDEVRQVCANHIYVEQAVIDNPEFWEIWSDNN